ncbi:flagellar hook capping FlgD N-terminal domain-containing protein [Vibrio breoganii]
MLNSDVASPDIYSSSSSSQQGTQVQQNSVGSQTMDWMPLFVSQIQNQNPLEPTSSAEYISQMAAFSQVQAMENMVSMTANQMVILDNQQILMTAGLAGTDVAVRADEFDASEVDVITGSVHLTSASQTVTLQITDEYGDVIEIPMNANASGEVEFSIDTEELGLTGKQEISVVLDEGQNYDPVITLNGTVDSAMPTGNGTLLQIAGLGDVSLFDVNKFGTSSKPPAGSDEDISTFRSFFSI